MGPRPPRAGCGANKLAMARGSLSCAAGPARAKRIADLGAERGQRPPPRRLPPLLPVELVPGRSPAR
eukprot:8508592-Alexandrium_andersonii.AAC.1